MLGAFDSELRRKLKVMTETLFQRLHKGTALSKTAWHFHAVAALRPTCVNG